MQMQQDVVVSKVRESDAPEWPSRQFQVEQALAARRTRFLPLQPDPNLQARVCAALGWTERTAKRKHEVEDKPPTRPTQDSEV